MKHSLSIMLIMYLSMVSLTLNSQSLDGAWEKEIVSEKGDTLRLVMVMSKGFFGTATYSQNGAFTMATGGKYELKDGVFTRILEFHNLNPTHVGKISAMPIEINRNSFSLDGNHSFKRIDNGKPGKLEGAWLISGRKRGDQIQAMDTNRPRKTMKILSGTRFQWIAFNSETAEFFGTGGGTYTTKGGTYTENIEFFSRDDSRAGTSLPFEYDLVDGNWHHSGKSSKGNPIFEIWSIRQN